MTPKGIDRVPIDTKCRVHGIDSLRVIDSSVMPTMTNGNINAPTIMIAEKAADHLLGREPLPPAELPVFTAQAWQQRQREGTPAR